MEQNIKEIDSIIFGVYSTEEIKKMSVCKVDNPKKSGYGTVYDERMGPSESCKPCETCGQNIENCPGHFGYIELNEIIIHPLFYKRVIAFLNCFCLNCGRLLLIKEQINLYGLNKYKDESRFAKIQEKLKKVDMCCHENCGCDHPKCKFSSSDNSIYKVYENKDKQKTSIILTTEEIKKIFDNILDEDIELLGFDPQLVHPKNLIMEMLPVLPICDRPFVKADGHLCDDDLTNQYIEIVKINNNLVPELDYQGVAKEISDTKKQKALASLRFRILTTFNNSQGKAKHTTNGRAIKGIKERLSGKESQLRNNLLGKRCNQTGRTVIGPDPTLKLGEIALPPEMADNLTIPIKVAKFNIEMLQKFVDEGKVDCLIKPDGKTKINLKRYRRGTRLCHGDIIIRDDKKIPVVTGRELVLNGDQVERNGKLLDKILPINRPYKLEFGWTVERKLQDGDYVILNRQPTLHKASMMAMQILIKPGKTIRMNLACTKGYNADFDGDEMNIHVPQSPESQAELKLLFATQWNIISAQSSKPSIAIVQDSLLGAYRMTLGQQKITRDQFFNVIGKLNLREDAEDRIQHIRRVLKEKGKKLQCYTGKGIMSMFLPRDLIYEKKNDADPTESIIKIWKGVIYEGAINKDIVGSSHNSLIHIINKEYGSDEASYFIDCIQFATNEWNMINIFSVGLGDCLVTDKEKQHEIQDVIKKCYIEAEGIKSTTTHPGIKEMRVNATLSKAKDIGLRIAKDSLNKDNNFLSTVISGSKGDFFNIAQITGLLGQQNLRGQRVPLFLNNGRRTLPHYPFGELSPEMEYESRGFISSSFIKGLTPREFYFHAMSGREGISDTAMGTATSGYMQRRIIKLTEDIKINYDGTVRDVTGNIFQISYGEMGLDPISTTKVKNEQQICDISRLINRLNLKHENVLKKKKSKDDED